MIDPLTIGSFAAKILGMVCEAAVKGSVGEAVKDAYKPLKHKIAEWAQCDIERVEHAPTLEPCQAALAASIDRRPIPDQEEVRILAKRLLAALQHYQTVGLNIGDLEAMNVELGSVSVTSGTGVQVNTIRVGGTF